MTLDIANLTKVYGDFEFGPVDLSVEQTVLTVLGPSGCGKTTLLSLIAGIISPDTGSVVLNGRELVGKPLEERRVGMVFQEGALFPHMTARENIEYAAADEDRVADLTALLELGAVLDRRPPTLSGGECQRVALARTLAADPDVLLLDEPLSSLDAPIRKRLRAKLHSLFESLDIPILYVTHDQQTATALGDRVAIVRNGAVEQVGPPSTVLEQPSNRFVARFTGNENVFEGRVTDRIGDRTCVRVGAVELQTTSSASPGSDVTVCIHPSRIELDAHSAATDAERMNTVTGTVTRWLNEGTEYQIALDIGNGTHTITTSVRPTTFERLAIDSGTELRVLIPQDSIHLISRRTQSR